MTRAKDAAMNLVLRALNAPIRLKFGLTSSARETLPCDPTAQAA
jgi:hypothetical protein